ncbi:MAG: hypothetical protein ACPGO5_02715 [Patescibacteria group bacterium]
MKKELRNKALLWGVIAILGMTLFYIVIMLLTMSPSEAWLNFISLWHYIVGIIVGFGIQVGLWVYIKNCGKSSAHGAMPGASGTMSGTAMVACCAHHLTEVLPVFGLTGATIFLTQYQKPFLILGVSINILGIAYMLQILQKHQKITINSE